MRGKSKCNTENWYSVKKWKRPGIIWDLERKRHSIRFFKCIEYVGEIKKTQTIKINETERAMHVKKIVQGLLKNSPLALAI